MPPPSRNQGHLDLQRNLVAGLKNAFEDPNHLANRKITAVALCEPVASPRSGRAETRPSSLPLPQLDAADSYAQKGYGSNVDIHSAVTNSNLTLNGRNEQSALNTNMNANGTKPKPRPKPKPKPRPKPVGQPQKETKKSPVKPPVKPKPTNIQLSPSPRKHSAESPNKSEHTLVSEYRTKSSEVVKSKPRTLQRQPCVQSPGPKVDSGSRPPVPRKPVHLRGSSLDSNSKPTSTSEFSVNTESNLSINNEHKNYGFVEELNSSLDNSTRGDINMRPVETGTEDEDILERQQSREEIVAERKRRNLEAVYRYHMMHQSGNPGEKESQAMLENMDTSQEMGKAKRDKDNKGKNKFPQRNLPSGEKVNPKTKLNLKDLGKNVRKNFQKRFSDDEILSGDELEKDNPDFDSQLCATKNASLGESSSPAKKRDEYPPEQASDDSSAKKKKKIHHKLKKFRKNFQKKFTSDEVQPESGGEGGNYDDVGSDGSFYDELDDDDDYFSDLEGQEAPSEDDLDEQRDEVSHPVKLHHNTRISYEITDSDFHQTAGFLSDATETHPDEANSREFDSKTLDQSSADSLGQKTTDHQPYDAVIYPTTSISGSFEKLDEGIYHDCQDDVFPDPRGFDENRQVNHVDNFESYDKFRVGGGETGAKTNRDSDSDSDGDADYEEVPDEDEVNPVQAEVKPADSNKEVHIPPVWDGSSSTENIPGHNGSQEEVTEDDEMFGEGVYHCAWNDNPSTITDHLYDETPATTVARKDKYTLVAKVKPTTTEQHEPTFAMSENVAEEIEEKFGVFSIEQRGVEDEDDDAASVDSVESGGVAHSEEDFLVSNRSTSSSGRYTQDGSRGAVFSFSSNPSEIVESPEGSSDFDGLSPDFMKRGPKLPSPMAPVPAKRTNITSFPLHSDYESCVAGEEAEVDMSGSENKGSDVPLYQVYDEGIKRKESLLLIGPKGLAKRRQIIKDNLASHDNTPEGGVGSGGSAASQHSEEQGQSGDYYDRWMEEEYGIMMDGNEMMESLYEPLDYEDYLESKRKKLFPLWRDQEEVKEAGLLEQLSSEEKELQEALYEIMTSEESYLKSLNLVITHFMESPELKECLQRQEHHTLFSNIVAVRNVSQSLFDDLVNYHGGTLLLDNVPDILVRHMAAMDCYVHYCANNQHQVSLMEQLKKKPHCKMVIQALEKHPKCQLLDLMSFLILPFQRITRLPLLIKAVLERAHGEVAFTADAALQAMTELAQRCNNEARRMEQIKVLHQIATSLVYRDGVKHLELSQKAILKKKGVVSMLMSDVAKFGKKKIAIKQRTLVVTSERVITAKERVKGEVKRLEVQDWCMSNRVYVEEITDSKKKELFPSGLPAEAVCVILITFLENNQKCKAEYTLCTSSESEKERWIQVLSTSSTGEMGEKIYDEYDCPEVVCIRPYQPRDMDELRLDLSDRIDVLTKIDDGWWQGKRLRDGATGWFPHSHVQEIENEHMRARQLKELHLRKRLSKEDFKLGSIQYNPGTISKHH